MSGIAGAIFYDQAFSVTVGLLVSYFTGIMLLPVLYLLVYRAGIRTRKRKWLSFTFNNPVKDHTLDRFYDTGVDRVFRHKNVQRIVLRRFHSALRILLFLYRQGADARYRRKRAGCPHRME